MANQVQVAKTSAYAVVGLPSDDSVKVPKIAMYVILEPGEGEATPAVRAGGVFTNIVRKRA